MILNLGPCFSGRTVQSADNLAPYSLHAGKFFIIFCRLLIFFKIDIFKKFFQDYHQSAKQFGPRSGPTFSRAWSGSNLFAEIISR